MLLIRDTTDDGILLRKTGREYNDVNSVNIDLLSKLNNNKSFNDDVMLSKPYTYCYACFESDMYLRVRGTDSPEMKERAYKEFGCKPFTMVSKCDVLTSKDKTTKIMGILK